MIFLIFLLIFSNLHNLSKKKKTLQNLFSTSYVLFYPTAIATLIGFKKKLKKFVPIIYDTTFVKCY